jgi:protein tyrosine/serine phosphatase
MASLLTYTLNTRPLREGSFRYIRSDVPDRLSDEDIRWLLDHDVRTVVDLRALDEAAKRPCPLENHPDFFYHHMPVSTGDIVPHCVGDVPRSYMAMADEKMEEIIALVENAPTNVLYFCNAGKDRTGVLSALLLRRMGASRQEIVDNFLITADNLKEMLADFVAKRPELSIHVVTPRAWYMETFLDRFEAREALR